MEIVLHRVYKKGLLVCWIYSMRGFGYGNKEP
jgi:hypothetical protein